jgi:hypothetical protein
VGLGGLVGNRLDGAFKDVAITAGHLRNMGARAYTMRRRKETSMGGAVMNTETMVCPAEPGAGVRDRRRVLLPMVGRDV